MALSEQAQAAWSALRSARVGEADRIADAARANRVVGVFGEGGVGKTTTIQQAVARPKAESMTLRVDLDDAASEAHLAFWIAKEVARSLLGNAALSILSSDALVPGQLAGKRVEAAELLGVEGLNEALREWPSGRYALADSLAAVEALADRSAVLLWLDHVETPALTPRHPLSSSRFLWGIRDAVQRINGLSVLISSREGLQGSLLGRDAPFHQQGEWLTLGNPTPAAWHGVARRLELAEWTAEQLARYTRGHPATMLLAILQLKEQDEPPPDVLRRLARLDPGLGSRSFQHARSLHRLGGQVLAQVALGRGPYAAAQRGASSQQEITKVLSRLRLAGLVRRHDEGWSPVNPLLTIALTERVLPVSAPDLESTWAGEESFF
ncbi:MAG TPA: hypothetical protein VGI73_04855 [Solirubrobacterales bacterium]|jgi:hypothetical protein